MLLCMIWKKKKKEGEKKSVPPAVCKILGNPFVYVRGNTQTVE